MYRCNYCPKTFSWPDNLKRHVKVKHIPRQDKYLKEHNDGSISKTLGESEFMDSSISNSQTEPVNSSISNTLQEPLNHEPLNLTMPKQNTVWSDMQISEKPIVFQHPFTMTVSGPTSSGKTHLLTKLLQRGDKISPPPDRIVYLYKRWQPLYNIMMESVPNIEFIRGIPERLDQDDFFDVNKNNVIVCDDMMSMAAVDHKIADLFTEGSHHRNLSVINLTQNLFPPGRNTATQRRNTQYMIIFKSPMSQDQIRTLGTFMFPGRLDQFLHIYNEATEKPYGYLVIDAKQHTPSDERFKTNIFGDKYVVAPPNYPLEGAIFHCDDCQYVHDDEQVFDKHICGQSIGIDTNQSKFLCPDCKTEYNNPSLLLNHQCPNPVKSEIIKKEDTMPVTHSVMETSQDKTYPCAHCGALYNAPDTLFNHIKQCGGGNDDDEDSEQVWTRMLNEVYEDNEKEYNEMLEKHGGDENAAHQAMREIYKSDLKNVFKRYFIFAHLLEKSDMYNDILEDFNALRVEKKYGKEKAIKAAIRKNDAIFDQVLDTDSDEEEEEEESDENL